VPNQLRIRRFLAFTFAAAAFSGSVVHTSGTAPRKHQGRPAPAATAPDAAQAAYLRLPLRFEPADRENGGDAFVARGAGYAVSVTAAGASLLLREHSGGGPRTVTMSLAAGNGGARAHLRRPLPGVSNYLIGSDRRRWVTGVRGYGEIAYHGVYRGVDVVYYGNQQKLEYDFVVAPGASAGAIALAFDGATDVTVDSHGDLVIATGSGNLIQHRPVIYQNDGGARRTVRGGYFVRRNGTVGFRIGKYDRRLPLVIDPVLSYATYLGGVHQERGTSVAVDGAGNVIVAGATWSPDFPTANAVQPHKSGNGDAFVSKLNPSGDALVYSTYIGGFLGDIVRGVAVDDAGNAYVAGFTDSLDFPTTNIGPVESRKPIFVIKIDPAGALAYATRIGGSSEWDDVHGIAVDADGRAHIAGVTTSADFPVVNAWQPALGGYPAFRTRDGGGSWTGLNAGLRVSGIAAFAFDHSQPGAVYAGSLREGLFKTTDDGATWTRANMPGPAQRFYAIAVQDGATPAVFAAGDGGLYRSRDRGESWTMVAPHGVATAVTITREPSPAVYVGFGWSSNVLRSVDGGDTWIDTGLAGPVQLLASSGNTVYATTSERVFRSSGGAPWVAANGSSHDVLSGFVTGFAVDPGDPQVAYAGTSDSLFKTTSGGAAWTSVWGFTSYTGAIAIAPSDPSTVFVQSSMGNLISHDSGQTWLPSGFLDEFLTTAVFDPADSAHIYAGRYMSADAFVATLSADGSRLEYSTFIGGARHEGATGIAVDPGGNTYVTGDVFSTDFPTVNPIQSAFGGLWDAFVVKLSPSGPPVYSTYLGGWASDYHPRIAADAAGRAYVTGITLSANFPVVNPWQGAHGGGFYDIFVTALNESGSAFVYSTYLGGDGMENDADPSIAVSPAGEVAVTGTTRSANFPLTTDAWHRSHAGGLNDVFVSRFSAAGTLQYSTFLGGAGADYPLGIAMDSAGAILIAGYTDSTDWATHAAVQATYGGSEDAFVVKMSPGAAPADTIAPTTTVAVAGTPGIPGWYASPVTVSLSALDPEPGRGLAFVEYSLNGGGFTRYTAPFVVTATGTTRITARATDWAGNVENPLPSTTVAIDTTGPTVGFRGTGTIGLAGWFTSAVTVTVSAVEPSSGTGVASVEYRLDDGAFQPYTSTFTVSTEGTTQVTTRATDRNGNVSTFTGTIAIDTSAPRTTVALAGMSGLAGWYRSPVTVSLWPGDGAAGSGIAAIEYRINDGAFQPYTSPFVVSAQGMTRITARARDRAGNVESPLPASVITIDSVVPAVTIASPEARDYQHSEYLLVSFAAADGGSGLQDVSAALDGGAVQDSQWISLLTLSLGAHTIEVVASDGAGNSARRSVSFRIVATIDSLIASVGIYAQQGKIDPAIQKGLLAKLNDAKAALDRGKTSSASAKLRDFIAQCTSQSGRGIAADAAAALAADAEWVLATF
jgi:hypothetical protein